MTEVDANQLRASARSKPGSAGPTAASQHGAGKYGTGKHGTEKRRGRAVRPASWIRNSCAGPRRCGTTNDEPGWSARGWRPYLELDEIASLDLKGKHHGNQAILDLGIVDGADGIPQIVLIQPAKFQPLCRCPPQPFRIRNRKFQDYVRSRKRYFIIDADPEITQAYDRCHLRPAPNAVRPLPRSPWPIDAHAKHICRPPQLLTNVSTEASPFC